MKLGVFRLAAPYFDGEGGGAGAPAAPVAPAAPTGGNPGAPSSPAPTGEPGSAAPAGQPQGQQPKHFTYKEDRSNWVPSHVVRQRTEELERLKREYFVAQQRIAGLAGIKPPEPPVDPETAQIREQFNKLFPGLAKLEGLQEKLERLAGVDFEALQSSVQATNQQVWEAHGAAMLRTLVDKASEAYGGQTLEPKAQKRLANAFAFELQEDPEMRARYEAGDVSVIDEFLKDYTGTLLDPYRKATAAAAAPATIAARRLPRGGGSSAIVGARPASLKPSDANFHKSAFDTFVKRSGQ